MLEGNGNLAVLPEYLHPLYEHSSENLNEIQRERLEQFLINTRMLFLCPPLILVIQNYYSNISK